MSFAAAAVHLCVFSQRLSIDGQLRRRGGRRRRRRCRRRPRGSTAVGRRPIGVLGFPRRRRRRLGARSKVERVLEVKDVVDDVL